MAFSLQKLRFPIIIISSVFFISWSFISNLKQCAAEDIDAYSPQDYHQDACKIYFDLGKAAQNRGDYDRAITFYRISLSHQPDYNLAHDNLNFCLASQKTRINQKNLTQPLPSLHEQTIASSSSK